MSKKTNLIVGAAATVAATSLLVGCNLYGKEKYKVTFETNGGNPIDPVEVEWGVEYKANVTPTKTGHTFKGWYFDVDLTNPVSEDIIIEGDISLFAKWEINQYTVSFNTNGGSTVSAVKLDYGAAIEVSDPTRVGYEFDGWYTDEELKESFDLKIPDENITVYAKWKENKVNITFNTNGSGVAGEMKAISYETEDETLTLPEAIYTRNGYSFKGWSTTPNGEVEFANKASISSLLTKSQDVTLYAVWEAREYDIHFLANGLAYGQDIKVKYDNNIVLPSTNPSKDGHEFVGWGQYKLTADTTFAENKIYYTYDSVSKIYSVVDVVIGGEIASDTYYEAVLFTTESKMPSANLTLNAIWSKNSYTITFNSNGAGEVSSITQAYGSVITLPTNLSKEGYRFLGWYKEASLTNRFEGSTMPLDGASLYAKWEANKYSIYFDANSGSGTTNKVDATYDVDATLTTNAFSKVGYTFKGWNTKEDGTGTSYTDGQTVKNLLSENGSSLTLYAKWEANTNTKYTVNIQFEGNPSGNLSYEEVGTSDTTVTLELLDYTGYITPENVQVYIKADGSATIDVIYERQSYKVTFTATNPETSEPIASSEIDVKYEGSITFPSSYHVKNYSLVWKYNGEVVNADTKVTGNMTLVAEYTKIEKTIVIHSEGQQNAEIPNVDAGANVLALLSQPSKVGYTFGGWYLDERFETELSSTHVMPEDNLDIYVKWNINQYTISFDSGVTSITQDYGTAVTAPANPSKTGYIFGGWLRNGQPYSFSTMPAEDVELVAKWEPISYSIVFDGNGGEGATSGIYNVKYDQKVSLTANGFERKGYSFLGWSTSSSDYSNILGNTQEVINLASSQGTEVRLYAMWEINTYTYNFIIVDSEGNTVEILSSQELNYDVSVVKVNTNKEDQYPTSYKFDGWYADASCETKVDVDEKAYTENANKVVNYYGKYSTDSYKIQFRNGNDGLIWELKSEGDIKEDLTNAQTQFYGYVRSLDAKVKAYDVIYKALESAINGDNNKLIYLNIYLTCFRDNTQLPVDATGMPNFEAPVGMKGFNEFIPEIQAAIIVSQGPNYGATLAGEEANIEAYKITSSLRGVFDPVADASYIASIMGAVDMNTMMAPVDVTSRLRTEYAAQYNEYKSNAYYPSREGYIFNGWEIIIDEVNNIKIIDAKWTKTVEQPINLRVLSTSKNTVTYAWNEVEGAHHYKVSYTIKGDDLDADIVNEVETPYPFYEIEGLKDGYDVELSVKACAETEYSIDIKLPVSEAVSGSLIEGEDYSRIEMNDNGTPEDTSDDTPLNYVIDKVKLDSEYTASLAYEHAVVGEIEITNAGDNYYRTENEFFFFESTAYEFKGVKNIEILGGEGEDYVTYDQTHNELHVLKGAAGKVDLRFYTSEEEYKEYTAYLQPKITELSFGSNLNTYLDADKSTSKFLNKNKVEYLVGKAIVDTEDKNYGYSYEDELSEKTYYNGFKFDIQLSAVTGNTYSSEEFSTSELQLDYKFYNVENPSVQVNPRELYIRDAENDVLFFRPDASGTYNVEISVKLLNELYLTEDQTPVQGKRYYDADGNDITPNSAEFTNNIAYYEKNNSVGLPQKTINEIKNTQAAKDRFTKTFTIKLDDSVNVFDDATLKAAYADSKVTNISIHSNIKANFATNQVIQKDHLKYLFPNVYENLTDESWLSFDGHIDVKEGTGVFSENESYLKIWNQYSTPQPNSIKGKDNKYYVYAPNGNGTHTLVDAEWVNNWESGQFVAMNEDIEKLHFYNAEIYGITNASLFRRDNQFGILDPIVINGNYFTVDASDVPYIQSRSNGSLTGSYKIQDSRVGIFESTSGDSTFNNIRLVGNTQNYSANLGNSTGTSMNIEKYMEYTSGGIYGFRNFQVYDFEHTYNGGNRQFNLNNVVVENTVMGISVCGAVSTYADYAYVNNSWQNSFLGWGVKGLTLTNSKFTNSGGTAIHVQDTFTAIDENGAYINKTESYEHPLYGQVTLNPKVNIDYSTCEIDNFISGEEPWFKQQGMEVAALNMKSGLDMFASMLGRTILKKDVDPVTGLETEKLNFVSLNMVDAKLFDEGAHDKDIGYDLTLAGFAIVEPFNKYNHEGALITVYANASGKMFVEYTINMGTPMTVLVEMFPM